MRPAPARPIRYQSQRQVSQVFRVPVFWEKESGVPRSFVGSKLSPEEGPEARAQPGTASTNATGGGSHTTARVRQVSSNEPVMTPGTATHQTSKQGIRALRESPQSKKRFQPFGGPSVCKLPYEKDGSVVVLVAGKIERLERSSDTT